MLTILAVLFPGIAALAFWMKRRHNHKEEERERAASGFPPPPTRRESRARSRTPSGILEAEHARMMWGPAQYMAATHGWEYTQEQESALGGWAKRTRKSRSRSRHRLATGAASEKDREMSRDLPKLATNRGSTKERRRDSRREKSREKRRQPGPRSEARDDDNGTTEFRNANRDEEKHQAGADSNQTANMSYSNEERNMDADAIEKI